MCGIAGIFRFDQQPVEQALLANMAKLQQHRGPDDEGFYTDDQVGLAFRRLAILDLSPAGHQPMTNADSECQIIYNGEIYNHDELRNELKGCGYTFRSTSDTEVILAAYQQWGVDCLHRFNGMWAFALWDIRQKRLFCARDRMGVKPFYYHINDARFLFASEIKTLFVDPTTPRMANENSIYNFLVFAEVQFDQNTFFKDIKQLPAAHYLLLDATGLHLQRYWQLDHSRYQPNIRDEDAIEGFRHLFFDSVRLRLQSDVPVGTCLSGGLDSSAIVCVANRILFGHDRPDRTVIGEKQKTFSACYENAPGVDERQWIEPVIAQTGAQSHYVFPTANGLFADLESMVWHQEEPVASSSIYAQWCVMRRAHQAGIVVMLDGQGGDEVMGGYQRYYWALIAGALRKVNLPLLWQALRHPAGSVDRIRLFDLLGITRDILPWSLQKRTLALRRGAPTWLGEQLKANVSASELIPSSHPTQLGQALERDLVATCLPALLKYEDRNSMAHSIEARVPFLDYRLVEYMASLPDHMKIRDGQMKWLLRQSLKDILPIEISQRRSKFGFGTPEQSWLQSEWPRVCGYFNNSEIVKCGWLTPTALSNILDNPAALNRVDGHAIWRWLNVEIWLRQFYR